MHRRGFLGSVLGTLAISQAPFLAAPGRLRHLTDGGLRRAYLDIFETPIDEVVHRFGGVFVLPNGRIRSTPLVGVRRNGNDLQFIYDDWQCSVPLYVDRSRPWRGPAGSRPGPAAWGWRC